MVSLVGLWQSWAGRLLFVVLPSELPVFVVSCPPFVLASAASPVLGNVRVPLVRVWNSSLNPRSARFGRSVLGFLSGCVFAFW